MPKLPLTAVVISGLKDGSWSWQICWDRTSIALGATERAFTKHRVSSNSR
jgi:hypothetical protein